MRKKPTLSKPAPGLIQVRLAYLATALRAIPPEKLTLERVNHIFYTTMYYSAAEPNPWLNPKLKAATGKLLRKAGYYF